LKPEKKETKKTSKKNTLPHSSSLNSLISKKTSSTLIETKNKKLSKLELLNVYQKKYINN